MAKLRDLPEELLQLIVQCLDQDAESRQRAVASLALSSREFTEFATKLLYQTPAVTELQISNFQRSVLTLKDVSNHISKLNLNLEKPGLYKASEFARLPNCTELVLHVNTLVLFSDFPQYNRLDKFLEAFPKIKTIAVNVTSVQCHDTRHRKHNYDYDCLLDANFCHCVDEDWNVIQPSRRAAFAPQRLISKLQVTARTLECLRIQLYEKPGDIDYEGKNSHWVDYFHNLSPVSFRGFRRLKELVIPGAFLACCHPRSPSFTEALLPADLERLAFVKGEWNAWYWLGPILEAMPRCFSNLYEVELWLDKSWTESPRSEYLYMFNCTEEELDSADIKIVYISETEDDRVLIGRV